MRDKTLNTLPEATSQVVNQSNSLCAISNDISIKMIDVSTKFQFLTPNNNQMHQPRDVKRVERLVGSLKLGSWAAQSHERLVACPKYKNF